MENAPTVLFVVVLHVFVVVSSLCSHFYNSLRSFRIFLWQFSSLCGHCVSLRGHFASLGGLLIDWPFYLVGLFSNRVSLLSALCHIICSV